MHRKLATMVEELQPDVAVISECADRDVLTGKLPAAAPWTSMAWAGSNPDKGLAVLTFGGYSLTELPKSEPVLEWVIPVKVTGPTSFTLLGVWASNHRAANAREFPLVNPQPGAALDAYEMTGPTILAGDFNHNVFWDHLYSQDKRHARTLVAAEQAGLVSAYHHARSEAQGEESEKTFYPAGETGSPGRTSRRTRRRRGRWTALLIVAGLALTGCAGKTHAAAPGADVGQQLDQPLPQAVLRAPLTTSAGKQLTLASLAGRVVVISDMMTLCQETCPFDTANVVAAARAVEAAGLGDRVEFLSITVDPARDTTAQIAAYRKLFPQPPADWVTLTAAPQTLSRLWADLGVYIQKVPDTPPYPRNWATGAPLTYDITHSDEVFALDDTGHERFILEGAPTVSAGTPIPKALRTFLDADGRQALAAPDALAWTLPQELQVISWLTARSVAAPKA
jgi:protein SCO1/2